MKRRALLAGIAAAPAHCAPRIAGAQGRNALKFIPQTDITVLDPVMAAVRALWSS